jgi:hypothetical protein
MLHHSNNLRSNIPRCLFLLSLFTLLLCCFKWANNNQSISLSEQILLILDQLFHSILPADSSRVVFSKSSSRLFKVANLHGNDRCQRGGYIQSVVPFWWRYYMFGPLNVVIFKQLVEHTRSAFAPTFEKFSSRLVE